jgi:hypothetical protein
LTEFYGIDQFPPHVAPGFRKHWLTEGMRLIRLRKQLEAGVDDDDRMYDLMREYAGEEAASDALYERKKTRRDAKRKAAAGE